MLEILWWYWFIGMAVESLILTVVLGDPDYNYHDATAIQKLFWVVSGVVLWPVALTLFVWDRYQDFKVRGKMDREDKLILVFAVAFVLSMVFGG